MITFGVETAVVEIAVVRGDDQEGRGVAQREVIEAGIGAVHEAEAVLPGLDVQIGPGLAVHQDRIADELGDPEGMHRRVRLRVRGQVVEDLACRVEAPVLDDERDVVLRECRQHAWPQARLAPGP